MSNLPLTQKVFTTSLTNSSLDITSSSGLKAISIFNASSTSGTVEGSLSVGGTASSAITIAESESYNVVSQGATVLDGITITAPSGCTLNITGLS